MQKQPERPPIKNLRDAYQVAGFRVRAKIDGYDLKPPAFVLTLLQRSKKHCAAVAENHVANVTTIAGAACGISAAAIAKFISIFKYAASIA